MPGIVALFFLGEEIYLRGSLVLCCDTTGLIPMVSLDRCEAVIGLIFRTVSAPKPPCCRIILLQSISRWRHGLVRCRPTDDADAASVRPSPSR